MGTQGVHISGYCDQPGVSGDPLDARHVCIRVVDPGPERIVAELVTVQGPESPPVTVVVERGPDGLYAVSE
jgi:hypothetical protein